jgi:hypothetical protein
MAQNTFNSITIPAPDPSKMDWNDDGVVILKSFLPENLMVEYEKCWLEENSDRPMGWA